jgi:hypothetical protein
MRDGNLAMKLLAELRRMPNATPAEALAEFRRRLLEQALAKGKVR